MAKEHQEKKNQNGYIKETKGRDSDIHYISYIVDAIFTCILIVLGLCDYFLIKRACPNYSSIPNNSFVVVVTLTPCVVTIVSLLLSIGKDEIYGATIAEINEMRGPDYFTLYHNVLVSCFVIIAHALLIFLGLRVTLWVLESIAAIYALVFVCQQLPIMAHSKGAVRRILRKQFQTRNPDNLLFKRTSSSTFEKIITEIVFEEGLGTAYQVLKTPKRSPGDLLDYLLDGINVYFWNQKANISEKEGGASFDGRFIEEMARRIEQGYNNVNDLLDPDSDGTVASVITINKYYHFTRTLFVLHDLCEELGLKKKEQKAINRILSRAVYYPFSRPDMSLKTATIVSMIATTLNSGETWFVEYLRDNDNSLSSIFSFKNNCVGTFTSMMMHHLLSKNALTEEEKGAIKQFMDLPAKGINSDGYPWNEWMHLSLCFAKIEDIIGSIASFLTYYDSVSEGDFYFHGKRSRPSYDAAENFTKRNLFHDWLLLVFSSSSYSPNLKETFKKAVETLSDENKEDFAEELSENWLDGGQLKEGIDCSFIEFYKGRSYKRDSQHWKSSPLVKYLANFHDNYYKQKRSGRPTEPSNEDIKNARNTIIESFNNASKKCLFYDSKLEVEGQPKVCFRVLLRGNDWKRLLDAYLDQMPLSLSMTAMNGIEDKIQKRKLKKGDKLDDLFGWIKEIRANKTSMWRWLENITSNVSPDIKEKIDQYPMEYIKGISSDLFWHDGAIRFNVKVDTNEPLIRSLTSSEIDQLIQKEYVPYENGLYRYSDIRGDEKHSYYVTKEELVKCIKATTFSVCIVFQYNVFTDPNGAFLFTLEEDAKDLLTDPNK